MSLIHTEVKIVAAARHELTSRCGDQQKDFEAKSRGFSRE